MSKGKLIVIEGACDGIGKSTQYKLLCERLEKDGITIANHHFPTYDEYYGQLAVKYLNGEYGEPSELSPYFINNLYAIDRAIAWKKKLKPLYEEEKTILLDRYTTSSIIYQTATIEDLDKRKELIDWITDFEYNKLETMKPDNVIFLSADFDLVTEMRKNRTDYEGNKNDIHERNLEFMKKVYDNAMFVADYLNWNIIKCDDDNGMRPIEDIHEDIYKLVSSIK